jgi:hypothetical protein
VNSTLFYCSGIVKKSNPRMNYFPLCCLMMKFYVQKTTFFSFSVCYYYPIQYCIISQKSKNGHDMLP